MKAGKADEVEVLLFAKAASVLLHACSWGGWQCKAKRFSYIVQAHDVANGVLGVEATSSVCYYISQAYQKQTFKDPGDKTRETERTDHGFHAKNFADTRSKGDHVHGVALVEVGAADKQDDGQLSGPDQAKNELSRMSSNYTLQHAASIYASRIFLSPFKVLSFQSSTGAR